MPDEDDAALRSLIERVELDGISYRVVAAELKKTPSDPEPPKIVVRVGGGKHPSGDGREGMSVALNVVVETRAGRAEVEPYAHYSVRPKDGEPLIEELAVGFADEVGITALIPFAREALSDISVKVLQEQILMPIFLKGQLRAEFTSAEE